MKKPIATITENREISMPNMMLNMPNRISPMIPTTKLPAQKAMFDVVVTAADNAFHNTFARPHWSFSFRGLLKG